MYRAAGGGAGQAPSLGQASRPLGSSVTQEQPAGAGTSGTPDAPEAGQHRPDVAVPKAGRVAPPGVTDTTQPASNATTRDPDKVGAARGASG